MNLNAIGNENNTGPVEGFGKSIFANYWHYFIQSTVVKVLIHDTALNLPISNYLTF